MLPKLYYADYVELPLPEDHRFPVDKYRLIREALRSELGVAESCILPSPLATKADLLLVHDPAYIEAIFAGTLDRSAQRKIGFPWSEGLVKRCLASTGGTYHAALQALQTGYGAQLAGGTHHAHYDFGAGYCVFNDFAVTISKLRQEAHVEKVAIVDLDVHHGDGNATLLRHDPNTFVFSMHGAKNYPSRKPPSDLDIGLYDDTTDQEFLKKLEEGLTHVTRFRPDLVLYQAGVDALQQDTLGRLSLSHECLIARDRTVFSLAKHLNKPIVHVLGGGYSDPISATIRAYRNTFQVAFEIFDIQP